MGSCRTGNFISFDAGFMEILSVLRDWVTPLYPKTCQRCRPVCFPPEKGKNNMVS